MIKELVITGETVEAAVESACAELGVNEAAVETEILEEPQKKKFGLFGENKPAKVKVTYVPTPAECAKEYLESIMKEMELKNVTVTINEDEAGAALSLDGDDIGFIIGHRGETLDSLQFLSQLVASNQRKVIDARKPDGEEKSDYYRITLDVGSFREKRKETLENLGKKMAVRAVKTGRNASLEPMNPYERRIIHTAVQTVEGAKSWSEGEDLARHVVIGPVDGERVQRYNRNSRFGGNRGGRGNNNRNDRRGGGRTGGKRYDNNRRYSDKINPAISETAPVPFSPAPIDTNTERKKAVDAPLYGRIELTK
ncbi:MAG: RNA-binding cell elongation regulator Jag/EloR [Clostridia bacterium]|nr:RNA-binding cell elongation regulator Jag/EloR [Clostridia bacterium]